MGVVPANMTLDAGVYELQVPAHETAKAPTFDEDILRADIKVHNVLQAMTTTQKRYSDRLTKPDAYLADTGNTRDRKSVV